VSRTGSPAKVTEQEENIFEQKRERMGSASKIKKGGNLDCWWILKASAFTH
jgi:hypothetical protein